MTKETKKNVLLGLTIIFLIVIVFGAAYAYFQASVGVGQNANIDVVANTTDSLMFETDGDLNLEINQFNFGPGMDNVSSSTNVKAILKANNKTNEANEKYSIYLDVEDFTMNHSIQRNVPELLLKITDPNGNELTDNLFGYEYSTVVDGKGNEISGYDLLSFGVLEVGMYDSILISDNYPISVSSDNESHTTTQEWKIEIIYVNLDVDQSDNAGKNFKAKVSIKKESSKTIRMVNDYYTKEIWGHKDKITKIAFEDSAKVYDNAEYIYDISSLQDKSVMAYMINNGDDTYTTYINTEGKVKANSNSSWLFGRFEKLTAIEGLENLDTSEVMDMHSMFVLCGNLTTLDLSHFDTSQVTDMLYLFNGCSSLTTLNVSNFNTSNVTGMFRMFERCSSLTTLDVSNFDTKNVTDMSFMFSNCNSLTEILYGENFIHAHDAEISFMFNNCPANKPTHESWNGIL